MSRVADDIQHGISLSGHWDRWVDPVFPTGGLPAVLILARADLWSTVTRDPLLSKSPRRCSDAQVFRRLMSISSNRKLPVALPGWGSPPPPPPPRGASLPPVLVQPLHRWRWSRWQIQIQGSSFSCEQRCSEWSRCTNLWLSPNGLSDPLPLPLSHSRPPGNYRLKIFRNMRTPGFNRLGYRGSFDRLEVICFLQIFYLWWLIGVAQGTHQPGLAKVGLHRHVAQKRPIYITERYI